MVPTLDRFKEQFLYLDLSEQEIERKYVLYRNEILLTYAITGYGQGSDYIVDGYVDDGYVE